jgi:hypothetical protein
MKIIFLAVLFLVDGCAATPTPPTTPAMFCIKGHCFDNLPYIK